MITYIRPIANNPLLNFSLIYWFISLSFYYSISWQHRSLNNIILIFCIIYINMILTLRILNNLSDNRLLLIDIPFISHILPSKPKLISITVRTHSRRVVTTSISSFIFFVKTSFRTIILKSFRMHTIHRAYSSIKNLLVILLTNYFFISLGTIINIWILKCIESIIVIIIICIIIWRIMMRWKATR